jgi:hypothetical protein
MVRDTAGVGHISDRAAARVPGAAPKLHRCPDDLMARIYQEGRRDRGVDSS